MKSSRNRSVGKQCLKFTAIIVAVLIIFLGEFLAPYAQGSQVRREPNAPVTWIRFRGADGKFGVRPFVYARQVSDPLTFEYEEVTSQGYPISLFVRGDSYSLFGAATSDLHLFGVAGNQTRVNILGTDALGRDRFSRLVIATRFSLVVCLIGTILASLIGVLIGMISGFGRGLLDTIIMGVTDTVLALPALVLILAARAAFPLELPPVRAATLLIMIFALAGWAEMSRLARGLVRSTREQDFVLAARASGCSEAAILFRHILPNIARPLLIRATIILPYFLLSEVSLSFLGVGLQEPAPSLGNMLAAASDLGQLQRHPIILLSPAFVIFVFVFIVRLATSSIHSKSARRELA